MYFTELWIVSLREKVTENLRIFCNLKSTNSVLQECALTWIEKACGLGGAFSTVVIILLLQDAISKFCFLCYVVLAAILQEEK